jgi:hypothetical protein
VPSALNSESRRPTAHFDKTPDQDIGRSTFKKVRVSPATECAAPELAESASDRGNISLIVAIRKKQWSRG